MKYLYGLAVMLLFNLCIVLVFKVVGALLPTPETLPEPAPPTALQIEREKAYLDASVDLAMKHVEEKLALIEEYEDVLGSNVLPE